MIAETRHRKCKYNHDDEEVQKANRGLTYRVRCEILLLV